MQSVSPFIRLLSRAARLPNAQQPRICRRCLHERTYTLSKDLPRRETPFLKAFRQAKPRNVRHNSSAIESAATTSSPLGALSRSIGVKKVLPSKTSSFPETNSKGVAYWLLGSAVSVFGIVVFGGLTRLTESGCAKRPSTSRD